MRVTDRRVILGLLGVAILKSGVGVAMRYVPTFLAHYFPVGIVITTATGFVMGRLGRWWDGVWAGMLVAALAAAFDWAILMVFSPSGVNAGGFGGPGLVAGMGLMATLFGGLLGGVWGGLGGILGAATRPARIGPPPTE